MIIWALLLSRNVFAYTFIQQDNICSVCFVVDLNHNLQYKMAFEKKNSGDDKMIKDGIHHTCPSHYSSH